MKKIYIACFAILPLFAYATPVTEGTYIGSQNKRISLANWEYDGVQQYSLMMVDSYRDNTSYLTTSKSNKIQSNQKVIFNVPHNPYDDEDSLLGATSNCQVEVKFSNNEFQLKTLDGCLFSERVFNDSYAYSKKSSSIPKKYWGKWGDCSEPAYIKEEQISPDSYYSYGVLDVEEMPNKIRVKGVTLDEGTVSTNDITFDFLSNNRVNVNIDYWDDNKEYRNLKKCS
ncbi:MULTISPECIES: hypothetical protein [Psychrobacter]|uniref:hypothetical protein n=1 Tax=Psychrobacter TaxID=497 RepID=UPI001917DC00|nr:MULTISPECIES: hypothetical protein [Psychrobacter]